MNGRPATGTRALGKVSVSDGQPGAQAAREDDSLHGLQGIARLLGVLVVHLHRVQRARVKVLADHLQLVRMSWVTVMMWHPMASAWKMLCSSRMDARKSADAEWHEMIVLSRNPA